MKWKSILFDLDGTLLDTSDGVGKAIEYTVNKMMLPKINSNELKNFIGPPIYESLKSYYGLSEEMAAYATEVFRNAYKDKFLFCAEIYPGITELLDFLYNNGILLAVATNKRQDYTLTLLEHFELKRKFDIIVGSDFTNTMKKTDIIQRCLMLSNKNLNESLMIGDTIGDYIGAMNNRIEFIGVSYGFGFSNSDAHKYREFNIVEDVFGLKKCIVQD